MVSGGRRSGHGGRSRTRTILFGVEVSTMSFFTKFCPPGPDPVEEIPREEGEEEQEEFEGNIGTSLYVSEDSEVLAPIFS